MDKTNVSEKPLDITMVDTDCREIFQGLIGGIAREFPPEAVKQFTISAPMQAFANSLVFESCKQMVRIKFDYLYYLSIEDKTPERKEHWKKFDEMVISYNQYLLSVGKTKMNGLDIAVMGSFYYENKPGNPEFFKAFLFFCLTDDNSVIGQA